MSDALYFFCRSRPYAGMILLCGMTFSPKTTRKWAAFFIRSAAERNAEINRLMRSAPSYVIISEDGTVEFGPMVERVGSA